MQLFESQFGHTQAIIHGTCTRPKNGTKYGPDKNLGFNTSFEYKLSDISSKVMAVERCIFRNQKGFKCTEAHSSVNSVMLPF